MKVGDTVYIIQGSLQNETGVVIKVSNECFLDVVVDGWNQISTVAKHQVTKIDRNPLCPLPPLCEKFP